MQTEYSELLFEPVMLSVECHDLHVCLLNDAYDYHNLLIYTQ